MNLWCVRCERFMPFDPVHDICEHCGTSYALAKLCIECQVEPAEEGIDVCAFCEDDLHSMYTQKEFQRDHPTLCAECRVRRCEPQSGICDTCYQVIVWGAPDATPRRPAKPYSYDWWSADDAYEYDWEAVVIPSVAEELETIPAMRKTA